VIIVVMAGSVVLFRPANEPQFPMINVGPPIDQDPIPPQTEQPMTPSDSPHVLDPKITPPSIKSIQTASTDTSFQMPVSASLPQISLRSETGSNASSIKLAHGAGSNIPASMSGRFGGTMREAQMRNKQKESSERAVLAGLNWLKEHQNSDGSWSNEFKPGMTGLATLCFLGHGELQNSVEYGPTVQAAIKWLLARGGEFDGKMSLTKDGWGGNAGVYEHAICTYALGEYFSLTQDDAAKDTLAKAIKYIVDGQNEDGGWKYAYAKGGVSDTSVTGWQVQALKAAHLTALGLPGVDEALDKCMLYLKSAQCADGGFGYHGQAEERYGLGGVGTLCTYFWKQNKDKLVRDGIKYIIDRTKNAEPVVYKGSKADLYGWYYNTQACLMFGNATWDQWNRWFQEEISSAQANDGSWPPMANAGVGGLQTKADGAGPYYRTTLCVLMLEVYYRNLPANKS